MATIQSVLQYGQQIWLDNLSRELIESGALLEWITQKGISGVTSNPSIFYNAISQDPRYQLRLSKLQKEISDREQRFESLVLPDIIDACKLLRPLYEKSKGEMGYVSFEVSPDLANDMEGTLAAARRLWVAIQQPNVMIKIPATQASIQAMEEAIAEGINVNVTLLFSIKHVRDVFNAYQRGLERRLLAGQPIHSIRSVASLFISRVDTAIDTLLPESLSHLKGTIAIASAKQAYQLWKDTFQNDAPAVPFDALRRAGAQSQTLLWASTGNKNPLYSDVRYIEELIGPHTINTAPEATLSAFFDHGVAEPRLDTNLTLAQAQLVELQQGGINLTLVSETLQKDGLALFKEAFHKLLQLV